MSMLSETYFADMDDTFMELPDSPDTEETAEGGTFTFHRENPSESGHYVAVTRSGYSDLFYSKEGDCWNYFDDLKKPEDGRKAEWDDYVKGWLELPACEEILRGNNGNQ